MQIDSQQSICSDTLLTSLWVLSEQIIKVNKLTNDSAEVI